MRDRGTKLAALVAAVALLAGCSSGGLDFPDVSDLNPFDDSCTTCAAPAPEPAQPVCAPAPEPVCAPPQQPVVAATQGRPANANPGEVWCYVRIPAVTRTVNEQVCVQQASCRQEWVPPVTKQVSEQVCVRQPTTRQIPVPAEYRTVSEQVCVAPGKTEWQQVDCTSKSTLQPQEQLGECWTLVDQPPQYETRNKQVCVREASFRTEQVPGQYETRMKTVTVQPGYHKNVPIAPVYETRSKQVVVSQPRWEWRRTTECEVPGAGYAPAMTAPVGVQPAPTPAPAFDAPAAGSPDGIAPPAGALPPMK